MTVTLENISKPVGKKGVNDWFRWKIFLKGSDEELDKIDNVTYILHPTFPNPVRKISDRSSNFAFSTVGWGEFEIKAKIKYKTGNEEKKTYWLNLLKGGSD